MRIGVLAAVIAALWIQPATAADFIFTVNGSVPVTETLYYGSDTTTWPDSCDGLFVCEVPPTHYVMPVSFDWVPGHSDDGINFVFGVFDAGPRAGIEGTARYLGKGEYEGLNLRYFTSPLGVGEGPWAIVEGETSSFSIRQIIPTPVPEPATWAMLLVGFGALGATMRRRPLIGTSAPA